MAVSSDCGISAGASKTRLRKPVRRFNNNRIRFFVYFGYRKWSFGDGCKFLTSLLLVHPLNPEEHVVSGLDVPTVLAQPFVEVLLVSFLCLSESFLGLWDTLESRFPLVFEV